MIKTIIGLILLLIPFLLIIKFENKKSGFFYILSFLLAFNLIVAVVTQAFHVFSYNIVLGINALVALIVLILVIKNPKKFFESLKRIKIDWMLVFIIVVLAIQFFSIHYDYTGKITTITENYKGVKDMKYVYPYFSDEWSAVSLIKYSIASNSLSLVNPLLHNASFPNPELPFHAFSSEILLLLNLNPLTQYSLLTIFTGLLVCILVYFILRVNHIGRFPAGVACLSVPYIINGANLPGIWTLIPLIIGIIAMLLGFLFISNNDKKMILFMAFLTLIFYPPLFVLYSAGLFFYFIFAGISKKEKIKYMLLYSGLCLIVVLILSFFVYFSVNSFKEFVSFISSKIFYETFTENAIPDFSIWKVIPIPVLLLSGFGLFKIIKRKALKKKAWLIAPITAGLIYWLIYSRVLWRFIIEYERVVVATSILIVILSGFGLHYLIKLLKSFNFIKKYKIIWFLGILVLILFFISAISYTERDNWQNLKLHSIKDEGIFNPASPANNYLHEDDLKLFENIKEKRFLSIPWKGLVIGTATNNYPLHTKPSTLTNEITNYYDFLDSNCSEKTEIAGTYEIDYIYSKEFKCKNFELIGDSEEGLFLYEFEKYYW